MVVATSRTRRSVEEVTEEVRLKLAAELRPWQKIVVKTLLDGSDMIIIAGTGSGKSLVFQSMMFAFPEAVVLVVSPLIALMEDQVHYIFPLI
jgi:superfamily II DNA helicase RecQ